MRNQKKHGKGKGVVPVTRERAPKSLKMKDYPVDVVYAQPAAFEAGEAKNYAHMAAFNRDTRRYDVKDITNFYKATIGKHVRHALEQGILPPKTRLKEAVPKRQDSIRLGKYALGVSAGGGKDTKDTMLPSEKQHTGFDKYPGTFQKASTINRRGS